MEIKHLFVWLVHPFVSHHALEVPTAVPVAPRRPPNPQSAIKGAVTKLRNKRNEGIYALFGFFVAALKTAKLGKAGTQLLSDFESRYSKLVSICDADEERLWAGRSIVKIDDGDE